MRHLVTAKLSAVRPSLAKRLNLALMVNRGVKDTSRGPRGRRASGREDLAADAFRRPPQPPPPSPGMSQTRLLTRIALLVRSYFVVLGFPAAFPPPSLRGAPSSHAIHRSSSRLPRRTPQVPACSPRPEAGPAWPRPQPRVGPRPPRKPRPMQTTRARKDQNNVLRFPVRGCLTFLRACSRERWKGRSV